MPELSGRSHINSCMMLERETGIEPVTSSLET